MTTPANLDDFRAAFPELADQIRVHEIRNSQGDVTIRVTSWPNVLREGERYVKSDEIPTPEPCQGPHDRTDEPDHDRTQAHRICQQCGRWYVYLINGVRAQQERDAHWDMYYHRDDLPDYIPERVRRMLNR